MTEAEEFEFRHRLEQEGAGAAPVSDAPNPDQNWAPKAVRGATGFATGVGEALNPLAIPHNLETLGLAAAHASGLEDYKNTPPVDENLPWYKRAGQAMQNAADQPHAFPSLRIEEVAPYLRAGVRSAGDLATLNAPNFDQKLAEEQKSQADFNESLPAGARAAGEIAPGIISLGAMGARGLKALGAGNAAESAANEARVSALGGGKAQVKKLLQNDQVQELGNQLKEDKIMGPFTSRPKIQENIEAAQSGYGQKIGNIVQGADATTGGEGIVPAKEIVNQAINEVWAPLAERSTTRAAAAKVADEIDSFSKLHGNDNLTLAELQQFKKDLSDVQKMFARQGDDPTVDAYKQLYGVFNKGGENALDRVQESLPAGQSLDEFQAAKKGYGSNTTALKMIADRNARDATNRMLSPSDYAAGIGAAAMHDGGMIPAPLKAIGAALVNKGFRQYGNQAKASSWQTLADAINQGELSPFEKMITNQGANVGAVNYLAPQPSWKKMYNKERR